MRRKHHGEVKSKRPKDSDLTQQRLKTWPETVPTIHLAIAFIVIGIFFIPTGTTLLSAANNVYEKKITYDDGSGSNCYIENSNQGRQCQVVFTFNQKVDGPIYLYYELENFFQNHRRYYQSVDRTQLQGEILSENDVSLNCSPLYKNGSNLLNPCGLIANSFFNDVFSINAKSTVKGIYLDDSDIALSSDKDTSYKQVNGFEYVQLASNVNPYSVNCAAVNLSSGCKGYYDTATKTGYAFYYPNDDTTQYLYETYPDQISPIDGVTDQHFMVWMKPSILPSFRKLYGSINGTFNDGDQLTIDIVANYEVQSFNGKKGLVITDLGDFGGKNVFPGQVYLTVGLFSFLFGIILFVKEKWLNNYL